MNNIKIPRNNEKQCDKGDIVCHELEHNTIYNLKFNVWLDRQIVPLIEILNSIPDLKTVSSCQGYSGGKWGHIFFYYKTYAELAELIFGKFAPPLRKELGEDIRLEMIQYSDESDKPVMGVLAFPTEVIPQLYNTLKIVIKQKVFQNFQCCNGTLCKVLHS